MKITVKIPRVNNEEILDQLVDDMTEEEYEQYRDLWDDLGPWRKALNWFTRIALVLLTFGYVTDDNFWIIFALTICIPLFIAGPALFLTIWTRCGKLILDIYTRLDRT